MLEHMAPYYSAIPSNYYSMKNRQYEDYQKGNLLVMFCNMNILMVQ